MAERTITHAPHLLKDTRFMQLFLQLVQQHYLQLPAYIREEINHLIPVITSSSSHYSRGFRDSPPVALQLTHLGSESFRKTIFHLLERDYEAISASTDRPLLDCDFEIIHVLLKVLRDDCAQIYITKDKMETALTKSTINRSTATHALHFTPPHSSTPHESPSTPLQINSSSNLLLPQVTPSMTPNPSPFPPTWQSQCQLSQLFNIEQFEVEMLDGIRNEEPVYLCTHALCTHGEMCRSEENSIRSNEMALKRALGCRGVEVSRCRGAEVP
nr:hypothetical protein HmN_000780000 [Hymenolepis microstoma]